MSLGMKQMGARSAGNPHAACDVAGAGDVAWSGRLDQAGAPALDPTCAGGPGQPGSLPLQHFIADEALIDATESLHKLLKHALQSADDFGKVIQQATTVEFPDIMSNRLDAKYAFAF